MAGRSYTSITDPRYKYTEKERDVETGYDYFGARYYDSRIGKFFSVDPLTMKVPHVSPYHYSLNNPMRFVDPTGMIAVENSEFGGDNDESGNQGRGTSQEQDRPGNAPSRINTLVDGIKSLWLWMIGANNDESSSKEQAQHASATAGILAEQSTEILTEGGQKASVNVSDVAAITGLALHGAGAVAAITPGGQALAKQLETAGTVADAVSVAAMAVNVKLGGKECRREVIGFDAYNVGISAALSKAPVQLASAYSLSTYVAKWMNENLNPNY